MNALSMQYLLDNIKNLWLNEEQEVVLVNDYRYKEEMTACFNYKFDNYPLLNVASSTRIQM